MASASDDAPGGPEAARRAVLQAIASIPPGQLASYGQIAQWAGLPGRARWVGRLLSQLPEDSTLPWHRVVAARGRLSLPADSEPGRLQRERLRAEGVVIRGQWARLPGGD